ncbi:uncharacterized protein PITG_14148 [Phytophthora infestans T30-4]|uniref:Uncharacterized protein n=1 Tax=Phytophthora infestans (strain T30-4) TaxID=403677 RepID=D0NNR2_PHYIT|nr:uncharacterized protein PITG_14148 [Phytophthora infestans T30-4]EEY62233.1 hypothetical protein PITG_14148 [Phytophthora infestans T30-4]|eukprot:XP_002899264.1 hypothetical protein PITG_14148 [Phytophthora infestans T30-4]
MLDNARENAVSNSEIKHFFAEYEEFLKEHPIPPPLRYSTVTRPSLNFKLARKKTLLQLGKQNMCPFVETRNLESLGEKDRVTSHRQSAPRINHGIFDLATSTATVQVTTRRHDGVSHTIPKHHRVVAIRIVRTKKGLEESKGQVAQTTTEQIFPWSTQVLSVENSLQLKVCHVQ